MDENKLSFEAEVMRSLGKIEATLQIQSTLPERVALLERWQATMSGVWKAAMVVWVALTVFVGWLLAWPRHP